MLAMGFLLLVSLILEAVASAAGTYFQSMVPPPLLRGANLGVSWLVIGALFALIYRHLPQARIAWRDAFRGGLVAGFLFIVGNFVLALYLGKGGPASGYGAAGSLVVLMLWVYDCAQILYFGAELTAVYAQERGQGIERPPEAVIVSLLGK